MLSRVAVLVAAVPLVVPFAAASAVVPPTAASAVVPPAGATTVAATTLPQTHGKPKAHGNPGHDDKGDNKGECPRGKLCMWTGPNFQGQRTVFADQADLGGRCRAMHSPIGSVANRTGHSPFRLHLFLFRGNYSTPCDIAGIYAQYVPGQMDAAVPDGPVSGVRIYADPETGGAGHHGGHGHGHRHG